MTRNWVIAFFIIAAVVGASGQAVPTAARPSMVSDVVRLVEIEKAFARMASEKGTKAAFLANFSEDGIVFEPTERNALAYWRQRPESNEHLAWTPNWADVSSDGQFGYTTGGWVYRANGRNDKPLAGGEFLTLWQKQADGTFKAVLDIGVSHDVTPLVAAWRSPFDAGIGTRSAGPRVEMDTLTDIFSNRSMANGYFNYLAEDARVLREGQPALQGRKTAFIAMEGMEKEFPVSSFLNFSGSMSKVFGNMMYVSGVYKLTAADKSIKQWNFVQVWKYRGDKWLIVADVFNRIPDPKK